MNRWCISLFAMALSLAAAGVPGVAAAAGSVEGGAAAVAGSAADQQLRALYEADWSWSMNERGWAEDGEGGYISADRLPLVDTATQQRRAEHLRKMLAELDRFLATISPRVGFARFAAIGAEAFPAAAPAC